MKNTSTLANMAFFGICVALCLYFAFAAVQGPSGILRRVQLESEIAQATAERDALKAEVAQMTNMTRRLSDDFLDLDLLDERARTVLGLARRDEILLK